VTTQEKVNNDYLSYSIQRLHTPGQAGAREFSFYAHLEMAADQLFRRKKENSYLNNSKIGWTQTNSLLLF